MGKLVEKSKGAVTACYASGDSALYIHYVSFGDDWIIAYIAFYKSYIAVWWFCFGDIVGKLYWGRFLLIYLLIIKTY